MTATLYLSRARLRADAPIAALKDLLLPLQEADRIQSAHKLLWTLFADDPDRRRDFLWREDDHGRFYILSQRAPVDHHRLFDLDEPKPFEPSLKAGDRLNFSLRANATVSKASAPGQRGKISDVVMDALHALPRSERAGARRAAVENAGRGWLDRQAEKAGFHIEPGVPLRIDGYRVLAARSRGGMRVGVLDFDGVLTVREPAFFLEAIARGFGRAKAFGFGLMLIRRAA